MNFLKRIQSQLRALFGKRKLDAEMDEEMRSHVDLRAQANIEAGMNAEEARFAALREFGWAESLKETCREQRGISWIENFLQDISYAFRQLLKNPGFTAVAVLTLALGIGVNTSMFTALQAVLSRPLPYADPESLVQVFQSSPGSPREPHHSVANFLEYRKQNRDFAFMAVMNDKPFNLSASGQPAERVPGLQVSADFFPLLGVHPFLGRAFTPEEDHPGHNNVVVLDYEFWQRRFAGDSSVVGRVIRLDGESVTVVGVMPARFHDIMLTGPISLWRPIAFTDGEIGNRSLNYLKCIARLKPDVLLTRAQVDVDVLARSLLKEHPDNAAEGLRLVPLAESSLPPQARMIVWSIMALAGFVLLIACANMANLQFARTTVRGREFAIRGALGAPRARLVRQVLTESVLLALIGGGAGVVLAQWTNMLLSRQFVADGETVLHLYLNPRVFGFALAASTLSGLAFGLMPAWLASRTDVNEALKQGSRGTTSDRSQHRVQHALIVSEVALALVLLTGAGLLVSGLRSFAAINPGWRVDGMTVGYLTLPEGKYGSGDAQRSFVERLQARLAALPGVEHVTVSWALPVGQFNVAGSFGVDGRPEPPKGHVPSRFVNGVTPGYFSALGMHLVSGRDFTVADRANRPAVVIINEALVRAFWPGESPLGQRINGEEIVGVVNDVRFPANPERPQTTYQTYRPFAQSPGSTFAVALRGQVPAATVQKAVADLDPDQPVGKPGPLSDVVDGSLDNWAVGGRILTSFALLGLSLAALGIYGVISGFVVRRTGEIGVRMALGAQLRDVLWLVLGKGLRLSLIGTVLGLVGAFGITRLLGAALPELPPSNPVVILLVAVLLIAITLIACWLPARRAAKVEPMVALRNE